LKNTEKHFFHGFSNFTEKFQCRFQDFSHGLQKIIKKQLPNYVLSFYLNLIKSAAGISKCDMEDWKNGGGIIS
jgi:hypothetical protein